MENSDWWWCWYNSYIEYDYSSCVFIYLIFIFHFHPKVPPMMNDDDMRHHHPYKVKEGENVVIECSASGQPKPIYSWYHQKDKPIRLKNNQCKLVDNYKQDWPKLLTSKDSTVYQRQLMVLSNNEKTYKYKSTNIFKTVYKKQHKLIDYLQSNK